MKDFTIMMDDLTIPPVYKPEYLVENGYRCFCGLPGANCLGLSLQRCGHLTHKTGDIFNPGVIRFPTFGLMLITGGSAAMSLSDVGNISLATGDVFVFAPSVVRRWTRMDGPLSEDWIAFDGPLGEVNEKGICGRLAPAAEAGAVREGIAKFFDLAGSGAASVGELAVRLVGILAEISRVFADAPTIGAQPTHRVLREIRANPARGWNASELAKNHGMSQSLLRMRVREITGVPLGRFIIKERINLAERILASGAGIKETASSIGMDDPCHFSRLFKKITGHSPTEFKSLQEWHTLNVSFDSNGKTV